MWAFFFFSILFTVFGVFFPIIQYFLYQRSAFSKLEINMSAHHVKEAPLQTSIYEIQVGNFFSSYPRSVFKSLSDIPWISYVSIKRKWPNRLFIKIKEHIPAARWNKVHLISSKGIVFTPNSLVGGGDLPCLIGPKGKAAWIFSYFNEFSTVLKNHRLKIMGMIYSPLRGWEIILARPGRKIYLKLGNISISDRFRQFVQVLPQVKMLPHSNVQRFDFRYGSELKGFSVKFLYEKNLDHQICDIGQTAIF